MNPLRVVRVFHDDVVTDGPTLRDLCAPGMATLREGSRLVKIDARTGPFAELIKTFAARHQTEVLWRNL